MQAKMCSRCGKNVAVVFITKLEGGVQTFDLAAGGVDIAPSQDLISDDVIKAVDEVKEKIISGDVVIPDNKDDFEAKYGDVYVLD